MKFKYLIIDEDGMPYGFNDETMLEETAKYQAVWNLETGEVYATWDEADKEELVMKEFKA